MKVGNVIRIQAIAIGFVAALFLASAAPAQEISNTEWPDGPNVVRPGHPDSGPMAGNTNAQPTSAATNAATETKGQMANQQVAAAQPSAVEGGWLTTVLVMGLAGSVVYALAESRRAKRILDVSSKHAIRSMPLL